MLKATLLTALTTFGLVGAVIPVHAAVLVQSTFDSDLGGWTATVPSQVSWSASGGNPGGRVVYTQTVSGTVYLIAPSSFLSGALDYTKLNGKAYISWQHELIQENDVTNKHHYEIKLQGPGGEAVFDGGIPDTTQLNTWFTVSAPLLQADWNMASGTWAGLLTDVESVEIQISLIENGSLNNDIEAIDNIKVVSVPKGFSPK